MPRDCTHLAPALTRSFLTELAISNPIGLMLTPDDVASWVEMIWPKYKAYGYKQHKRALASWWMRVREAELAAAIERRRRLEEEAENRELDRIAEQLPKVPQETAPTPRRFSASSVHRG